MKYAFVQRHRRVWPISVQCRVLRISLAGYHEHFVRKASQSHRDGQRRHLSDDALLVHIKVIHAETRGGYGWPRIWKELLAVFVWESSGCKSSCNVMAVGANAKLSRLVGFVDDPLSQVDGLWICILVGPIAIPMAQSKVGRGGAADFLDWVMPRSSGLCGIQLD